MEQIPEPDTEVDRNGHSGRIKPSKVVELLRG